MLATTQVAQQHACGSIGPRLLNSVEVHLLLLSIVLLPATLVFESDDGLLCTLQPQVRIHRLVPHYYCWEDKASSGVPLLLNTVTAHDDATKISETQTAEELWPTMMQLHTPSHPSLAPAG